MHAYHHMNEDQQDEIRMCATRSEWVELYEEVRNWVPSGNKATEKFLRALSDFGIDL